MRIRGWGLAIVVSVTLGGGLLSLASPALATPPEAPLAVTREASEVKRVTAVLNGAVRPFENEGTGEDTFYYYEYGSEPCNEKAGTCGTRTFVKGPTTETLQREATEVKVTRLKPGTTYHYWFAASGPGGTAHGEEMTFTTTTAEPEEYIFDKDLEIGSSEKPNSPTGIGIDKASGDVYIANYVEDKATIEQFNAEGVRVASVLIPGNNEKVFQLAVDNSGIMGQQGDVYAADPTGNIVYKFVPNSGGKLELDKTTPKIGEGNLSEPRGVAVDSRGNVYVASTVFGTATVSEFSPTGKLEHEKLLTGLNSPHGSAIGLSIDASGNIYLACQGGTAEYNAAGTCTEPEPVTPPEPEKCKLINAELDEAIAFNSAGDVFIASAANSNGEGPYATHEYETVKGYPEIKNAQLERAKTFTELPSGLGVNYTNNTLYVSEAAPGSTAGGAVKVFRFLQSKPVVVTTKPVKQESGSIEVLNGEVNPGGQEPAEYYFEYGTSACDTTAETCGTVAIEPSQVVLYGDEPISVSTHLAGLAPNTTYHYWIVAANEGSGVEHGEEQTFTTGPTPPSSPPAPAPEGAAPESKTPASSPAYPLLTGIAPVPIPRVAIPKRLTRAQQLAKALAACNRKPKKQRAACKRQARKRYGPARKSVAKKRRK